jgi:excisionase family DNA binding protein
MHCAFPDTRKERGMVAMETFTVEREGLTVNEFCHALGIGRTTAYAMIGRGEIRTRTFGARRIVPRSEVARLLHGDDGPADDNRAA